jgi:hypothetical protein
MLIATSDSAFAFTTMSGDATLSGTGVLTIGNDKITTAKILNGNVTNAKLANSTITINGTGVALGGSITTPGFANPMTDAGDMIIGGASGAPTKLPVNAGGTRQVITSKSGITTYETFTINLCEDVEVVTPTDGQVLTYDAGTGTWINEDPTGGSSTSITCIAKITAQHVSLNTQYTLEIYPHGRTGEGGDVTWSGATAYMLQIAAGSDKVPVDTWVIAVGTQKVPAPSPLAGDHTDYNWYIQPPIWM